MLMFVVVSMIAQHGPQRMTSCSCSMTSFMTFTFFDSLFLQVLTHVIFDDILLIKLVVDIAFNNKRINQVYVIIDIPV